MLAVLRACRLTRRHHPARGAPPWHFYRRSGQPASGVLRLSSLTVSSCSAPEQPISDTRISWSEPGRVTQLRRAARGGTAVRSAGAVSTAGSMPRSGWRDEPTGGAAVVVIESRPDDEEVYVGVARAAMEQGEDPRGAA